MIKYSDLSVEQMINGFDENRKIYIFCSQSLFLVRLYLYILNDVMTLTFDGKN